MIDDYFKTFKECVEKYGEKTSLLYACGSFYEVYKVDNEMESIGNADKIAEILNIAYSKKNKTEKSTRSHPNFAGFTKTYLSKYITPLLENDYTVVIVDELETSQQAKGKLIKRGITAVHTQCLKSPDFETTNDAENSLTVLMLESVQVKENIDIYYSLCNVNNITNDIELIENVIQIKNANGDFKSVSDELSRLLSNYNSKEIRCYYVNKNEQIEKVLVSFFNEIEQKYQYINIDKNDSLYKEYNKISFQNEYLKNVYTHVDFGMEDPINFMFLENMPISRINLLYTLDYISRYDKKYITNLSLPKIINENRNLVLELNTSEQLHLLPKDKTISVFSIIDFTKTAIGKRYLKHLLTKPFLDVDTINSRYNLSDEFRKLEDNKLNEINKVLECIVDFKRLHRKMGLEMLHPYEFCKLHDTYIKIMELIEIIKICDLDTTILFKDNMSNKLIEYINEYNTIFNLEEMKRITLQTSKEEIVNFFKTEIVTELDEITDSIVNIEMEMESLRKNLESKLEKKPNTANSDNNQIKLLYTENDGYYFCCTKIRYTKLTNECKNDNLQFTMRSTSNMCKFTTQSLTKLSNLLIVKRDLLAKKIKLNDLQKCKSLFCKHYTLFEELLSFIRILDITMSNVKCGKKYLYTRPQIKEGKEKDDSKSDSESFINITALRHPIIERISSTEYIPNDITLDKNNKGLLLYGLNSSGKSSLLRALGISIVLAQCGLYVPCEKMEYSPFKTLISQVDLTDNLFSGKSSFISEMCGSKKILNCVGKNTLVLSDELCRGTEVNSSCAIVTSCLMALEKSNTKFFFTTHLHEIAKLKVISGNDSIKICHLGVETKDNIIIFNRKMCSGPGSDLYGLEVCKSIIKDPAFIDIAFDIRNEIIENKKKVLSTKKSRYNSKKIIHKCEVCGYQPKKNGIPLDTHHINEQKNCDSLGFVKDKAFHKNEEYNLVSLCKSCHLKIDTGELIIKGYISTTSGRMLDYTKAFL